MRPTSCARYRARSSRSSPSATAPGAAVSDAKLARIETRLWPLASLKGVEGGFRKEKAARSTSDGDDHLTQGVPLSHVAHRGGHFEQGESPVDHDLHPAGPHEFDNAGQILEIGLSGK